MGVKVVQLAIGFLDVVNVQALDDLQEKGRLLGEDLDDLDFLVSEEDNRCERDEEVEHALDGGRDGFVGEGGEHL